MKRTLIISGIIVVVAVIGLIVFNSLTSRKKNVALFAESKKGNFELSISSAGELLPEKSIEIKGPEFTQSSDNQGVGGGGRGGQSRGFDIRFMDLKIQDIVPEGTFVNKGDYVAQLDRTTFDNTMRDEMQNLANLRSNLELKILDTAVTMTTLRDQIKNQVFTVEEAVIYLEQSKYEPPAVIRKAELSLDKARRSLEQLRKAYHLREAQTLADINLLKASVDKKAKLIDDLQEYLSNFTIKAPDDGMIIYKKDWNGAQRKTGSSIHPFDMVVATLPDLAVMLSKTYINEIEVNRIKPGLKVDVSVDAFPDKKFTGTITSVANIGEVLPNSDAKMFETLIKIEGTDPTLRPGMTTGNKIIIKTIENAVYVPAECVQTGPDSIPFIYLRNRTKHVVLLGESNEKNIIIEKGLEPGTGVYLITPEDPEKFKLTGKDIIPLIREREKAKITSMR